MDLTESTVVMDRDEARHAYESYAEAVRRRHSDEDAAIAAGYKALSEGKTLITLTEVIRRGGVDDQHRPRLAVAPALTEWVWMARSRDGAVWFSPTGQPRRMNARGRVNLGAGTLPEVPIEEWQGGNRDGVWRRGVSWDLEANWSGFPQKAMVPTVPAHLRPSRALTGYHVLFEAEWQPEPPVDPALIRHLAGDLWMVLATWDLTDLERAVLRQRTAQ